MKKLIVLCLSACLGMGLLPQQLHAQEAEPKQQSAQNSQDLAPSAKAAYLVENTTGKVIYAKHETDKLYPASMTKMMGLLLIFEALHDKKSHGRILYPQVNMRPAWVAVRSFWSREKP